MNLKIMPILMLNLIILNGRSAAETKALLKESDCLMHKADLHWHDGAIEAIEGRIQDVIVDSSCPGYGAVLQFKVQGTEQEYQVKLGPAYYLNPSRMRFAIGDSIKVIGAIFESQGQKSIIASEIERNGEKLILRDKNGHPLWHSQMKQKAKPKDLPGTSH